jgi:4-hydroxymandelate oxidase
VGGEPGVLRLLRLLAEEFLDALGLAGCARPGEAAQLATVSLRADEGTRRR